MTVPPLDPDTTSLPSGENATEETVRNESAFYLYAAGSKVERALGEQSLAKEVKKRKRSETPPEDIRTGDEARYAEQEERAAKRANHDMDYQEKSSTKSLSD